MERWRIQNPGAIRWDVAADPQPNHMDHVELSGQRCAMVARYGTDSRRRRLEQALVFPGLRTIPNDTHASLTWTCAQEDLLFLEADGQRRRPFGRGEPVQR